MVQGRVPPAASDYAIELLTLCAAARPIAYMCTSPQLQRHTHGLHKQPSLLPHAFYYGCEHCGLLPVYVYNGDGYSSYITIMCYTRCMHATNHVSHDACREKHW